MREVCCVVRPSSISLFFRPHTKEQLNKWNKTNERQRMRVCFIIFNLVFWLWFFFFPLFSLTFSLHWNKGKQKWPQGTNEVNNNKSVLRSFLLLFFFHLSSSLFNSLKARVPVIPLSFNELEQRNKGKQDWQVGWIPGAKDSN